jgi:hypothetical protein
MDRSVRESTDGCNDDGIFIGWVIFELVLTGLVVAGWFIFYR